MLDVLPSRVGKLSSEPDWDRYFGIEFEFVPGGKSQLDYRFALYDEDIDTLDDPCRALLGVRGRGALGPGRFYAEPDCKAAGCSGRGGHVYNLLVAGGRVRPPKGLPEGFLDALREAAGEGFEKTTMSEFFRTYLSSQSKAFRAAVEKAMPRVEDPSGRFWNLGTDPSAGLELRTIPLKGKEGWRAVERACAALSGAGGDINDNCGGHIHLDMTEENDAVCGRTLIVYRMIEPLLAAPVNPTRYFDTSYNPPTWKSHKKPLSSKDAISILRDKKVAAQWGSRWLASQQLQVHGTFEFRGLEGSLDPSTFKNYALILGRFIQSVKQGGSWGVRLKSTAPIAVTDESIAAFLEHLDMTRGDLSPELKEAREWYISRIAEFRDRDAFQQHLVTGHADLKKLRECGKFHSRQVFEELVQAQEARKSDKELGLFVIKVIEKAVVASNQRRNDRGAAYQLDEDVYSYMGDATRYCGLNNLYSEIEPGLPEFRPEDRELYEWLDPEGDTTFANYLQFCDILRSYDLEALGAWWRDNLFLTKKDEPDNTRLTGLCHVLSGWLSIWSIGHPPTTLLKDAFIGGDISCVDF